MRRAAAVLALLAAGASAARAAPALEQWAFRQRLNWNQQYIENGERLVHSLPLPLRDPTRPMPLVAVQYALMSNHAPASWTAALEAAPAVLVGLLTFALAWALGGRVSTALAAAAAGAALSGLAEYDMERWYAALVLGAACAAAWRALSPGRGRGLASGAATALSVWYRSPLLLWPAVTWADERLARRRPGAAAAWPAFALAAALALPWAWARFRGGGDAGAVQRGEGSGNLVWAAATDPAALDRAWDGGTRGAPGRAASWLAFAGHVALHPGTAAEGTLKRAAWAAGLHPFLLALALAAAWRRRAEPAARSVALLAGYFACVHLPLGLLEHYLVPLWPLLCALAASAAPGAAPRAAGRALALAAFPLLAAGGAFAAWGLARAGALAAAPAAYESRLDAETASHPSDPWLAAARGRLRLERGEDEAAFSDLRSALRLGAARPDTELLYAWLLARRGRPLALLRVRPGPDWRLAGETALRQAAALAALGRRDEARARIRAAVPFRHADAMPEIRAQIPAPVFDWLRDRLSEIPDPASAAELPGLTPEERVYLASEIEAALPRSAAARARAADARRLASAGRFVPPAPAAPAARPAGEEGSEARRIELAYRLAEKGRFTEALRSVEKASNGRPWRVRPRLARARLLLRAGRPAECRRELKAAGAWAREPEDAFRLALAWQDLAFSTRLAADADEARARFDRLVAASPSVDRFSRSRDVFLGALAVLSKGAAGAGP